MKRIHIHVNAQRGQFEPSVAFYTNLFGQKPTKQETGYAKWMLDDPLLNFALEEGESACGAEGIDHLGIEVTGTDELRKMRSALQQADVPLADVGDTVCCYAQSEKAWTADPSGVRWEAFRTYGDAAQYGQITSLERATKQEH